MRLYKYLNENITDVEEIIYLIEKDCQPFIKDWEKLNIDKFLYSGRRIYIPFDKKKVRKDRQPKDTSIEIHKFLDEWFYKKFGVKARSNSIFCTFEHRIIGAYGDPYIIFPIGKYIAINSSVIEDFFNELHKIHSKLGIYSWETIKIKNKVEEFKNILYSHLDKSDYKKGLRYNMNEIMINCKEYYIVSDEYQEKLLKHFKG